MTETTHNAGDLLTQLTIDRDAPPERTGGRLRAVLLIAALAGTGLAALTFEPWQTLPGTAVADGHGAVDPAATAPAAQPAAQPAASIDSAAKSASIAPATANDPGPPVPSSVLDASGYVVARRQATVSASTTGRVTEVLMEEGMAVTAGQVIARLDDALVQAQLALAQAEVAAASATIDELDLELAQAGRELARFRELGARGLASESEVERRVLAEAALAARRQSAERSVAVARQQLAVQRQRLAELSIRAPFAGVVIDKAAQPGETVSPLSAGGGFTRTGLGTIVDMSSLEVEVDVNEAYINRVSTGQRARVTLNAHPDRPYQGRVLTVVPAADRARATVTVRISLDAPDRHVLPNMGVRVAFLDYPYQEIDT